MNNSETLNGYLQSYKIVKNENDPKGGNGVIRSVEGNGGIVVKVFNVDEIRTDRAIRLKRFNKEIDFLKKHQNKDIHIPKLIDSYKNSPEFFVMKKYLTINDFYASNPTNKTILQYCLDLIDAIKYIHSQGFAHRDIKPTNILFDKKDSGDGYVLILCDFGLISEEGGETYHSKMGSYTFTPPELMDRSIIDTDKYYASDVYSFAKTVYALLKKSYYSFNDGIERIDYDFEIKSNSSDNIELEPVYEMIEKSIKFEMNDRIGIEVCEELIKESLNLINGKNLNNWYDKRRIRRAMGRLLRKPEYIVRNHDSINQFLVSIVRNRPILKNNEIIIDINSIKRVEQMNDDPTLSFYVIENTKKETLNIAIKELIYTNEKNNRIFLSLFFVNDIFNVTGNVVQFELLFATKGVIKNPFSF